MLIDPKTLTELQTLEYCRDLWRWLEEHPKEEKRDWPGWRKFSHSIEADCFACQYSNKCKDCILKELWPNMCINEGTPYLRWRDALDYSKEYGYEPESRYEVRRQAAKEIADFCQAKINTLTGH